MSFARISGEREREGCESLDLDLDQAPLQTGGDDKKSFCFFPDTCKYKTIVERILSLSVDLIKREGILLFLLFLSNV
jgi:hypothetical protein